MRVVDIVFLYEHAARELDVACAVSARLQEEHGVSVEVVHWPTGIPIAVTRIRPRLVVLPTCYTERNLDAVLAYWREAIFFNLTWEQLFYLGNRKAKTPRGKFALEHVIHHAWSEDYVAFLLKSGIEERNIYLNGHPAYTLYDEPYRRFFSSRSDLAKRNGLDPSRRWIFFPENYNWAFYSEKTLKYFVEHGQSADDVAAMRDYCDQSFRTVVRWFAEVAERENVEVILRPRPATTLEDFRLAVDGVLPEISPRLHINQSESVREWIQASDLVMSSHSTSMIEAAIAGKPVFMVEPYPIPSPLNIDWLGFLPHIQTREEFFQICLNGKQDQVDSRLANWARKTLMGNGDSIQNITTYLVGLHTKRLDAPPFPSRKVATPSLRWIPPAWLWSIYRRLKQWIRYTRTGGIEPEYMKDVVDRKLIELMLGRWIQLLKVSEVEG
jgi:surface carbohydrate biosynthesis protein